MQKFNLQNSHKNSITSLLAHSSNEHLKAFTADLNITLSFSFGFSYFEQL
jgi:hypothetical protein